MPDTSRTAHTRRRRGDAPVRIGGASGFWGDSSVGAPQLVRSGLIDYLVFDYLAETTMSILAAARAKKPELGYATDFVDGRDAPVLPEVMRQRHQGRQPTPAASTRTAAPRRWQRWPPRLGVALRIAVVEGDDVSALMPALRDAGTRDMYTGEALPDAGAERQRLPRRAADRARRWPPAPTSSSPAAASTAR